MSYHPCWIHFRPVLVFEVGPRRCWSIARVEPGGASRRFPVTLDYLVEAALDMGVKLSAEVEAWKLEGPAD